MSGADPADKPGAFILVPDPAAEFGEAPKEQAALYVEVCRTLKVLQTLRGKRTHTVTLYYMQLNQIAAIGLTGTWARPRIAAPMLVHLQREILDMEAPYVKTGYMNWLAKVAAAVAIPAFLIAALARWSEPLAFLNFAPAVMTRQQTECVALLVAGSAIGVWLSFGARKPTFTFNDLLVLEEDFLGPKTRVGFTILLTLALALLFKTDFVAISVGDVSTANVFNSRLAALIVGILCGFSEKSLSSQLATQANRIIRAEPPAARLTAEVANTASEPAKTPSREPVGNPGPA